MSKKTEKPYVLRAAEFVYSNIVKIKSNNHEVNNIKALEILITSEECSIPILIASGLISLQVKTICLKISLSTRFQLLA